MRDAESRRHIHTIPHQRLLAWAIPHQCSCPAAIPQKLLSPKTPPHRSGETPPVGQSKQKWGGVAKIFATDKFIEAKVIL